jgi:hypothetical protein
MNCGVCLEPSSSLKVTVWDSLDWGMQTLRSAIIDLHRGLVFVIQPEYSSM